MATKRDQARLVRLFKSMKPADQSATLKFMATSAKAYQHEIPEPKILGCGIATGEGGT
jgi:hypothetical protein